MGHAHILVGLGFGDEGKGSMVDYLCSRGADLVIRYNGGSQAAHNVVTPDGQHHMFQQIGSGAFCGAKTLLSRYMMVDLFALGEEVQALSQKLGRHATDKHFIDCRAPVITPFHVALNQLREWSRGAGRHGSCGKGIGELGYDLANNPDEVLRARDTHPDLRWANCVTILTRIQELKREELKKLPLDYGSLPIPLIDMAAILNDPDQPRRIADAYKEVARELNILNVEYVCALMCAAKGMVFEGAQGVLLDEDYGFHPYTTWSKTTQANALALLHEIDHDDSVEVTGIVRSYGTRHGAGPFPTEDKTWLSTYPGEHNGTGHWQGDFRAGWFDGVLLRYAINRSVVDNIALTHVDTLERAGVPYCDEYLIDRLMVSSIYPDKSLTERLLRAKPVLGGHFSNRHDLIKYIEQQCGCGGVRYVSTGPTRKNKEIIERIYHG